MNFGETLRLAREAKNLTASQVAAQTHILVQIIEDMEQEDFHRVPAAIYGRGFVRHYAECVGLDPVPLVAEFMAIYEGHKAPVLKTRTYATPPEEEKPAIPEPIPEPVTNVVPERTTVIPEPGAAPAVASAPETSIQAPSAEPVVAPAPVQEVPESVRGLGLFDPAAKPVEPLGVPPPRVESPFTAVYDKPDDDSPSPSEKFRQGLSAVSHGVIGRVQRIPRSAWRVTSLVAAASLVVVLFIFGCIKLYQITATPAPEVASVKTPVSTPKKPVLPSAPAVSGTLRSTGEKVPQLYLD